MKIIILSDKHSKKYKYMADAVILAALEKHVRCQSMDISDYWIDASKTGLPEYIQEINKYITEEQADMVLCTSLNGMRLMTDLRKQENTAVSVCGIVSDYSYSPSILDLAMDLYFVPHDDIKQKLIKKGMKQESIYVTGIPVKRSFRERIGKAAARNYLVIPKNRRIYLLIPDGLSLDTVTKLSEELAAAEKEDYVLYIPTARSSTIRDQLLQHTAGDTHIRIITYTKQLNLYLESADAMLLKPDTLTSTEAAVSGVPIVHLFLNASEKAGNNDFFVSHEMAVIGSSIRDTVCKAKRFVEEKAMATRVIQMQYRNIYSDAADKIIDIIIGTINAKAESKTI